MIRSFASCTIAALLTACSMGRSAAIEPVFDPACDTLACDAFDVSLDHKKPNRNRRTPAMIGDFYAGPRMGLRADANLGRLLVIADDLDAPLVLPGGNAVLTLTEAGPVGIFNTPVQSIQELQTLLRSGTPFPAFALEGTVNADATMTTTLSVAEIQTLLASTGSGFDIISLQTPPGSYRAAVAAVFAGQHGLPGTTVYDGDASGAMLQAGVDTLAGGEDFDAFYFFDYVIRFDTAIADVSSGGVGRMKIAEGGTVLPQDRVFFRYSYLDQVRYTNAGVGLNRYVPGFEKTFMDGLFSVEMRAPFVTHTATSSTIDGDAIGSGSDTEFGNLTIYPKVILYQAEQLAISGGMGIVLPTAGDVNTAFADGTPILNVANDAVRLQPFLGGLYTPSERLFVHSFFQVDVETTGNPVRLNTTGNGLENVGKISDGTNLFVDAGVGYWLYRSDARRGLTGVIPTVEIHQNIGLSEGDIVGSGPFMIGNFHGRASLTNVVAGSTFEFGQRSHLTAAYVGPIGGGSARAYDGGLQMMFNHFFGP